MNFLHKLLPIFLLPVALSVMLIGIGTWKKKRSFLYAAILVLWILSTPIGGSTLVRLIEGSQERRTLQSIPFADAIVVLSEGRVVAPGPELISEWTDADRFFGGLDLFERGKAPLLVFTGGSSQGENVPLEGEILRGYAVRFGVPDSQIVSTRRVTNTEEEAQSVASILKSGSRRHPQIILVTSAFLMKRARSLFERNGLLVVPFPVDFHSAKYTASFSVIDILPSAGSLSMSEYAIRELYGRLFYTIF